MPVVLDLMTSLESIGLDTRGNAQHWAIRTMDAALERTIDNWLARVPSQEAWNEAVVTPAVLGWQGYLTSTGTNKRGLLMADVKRKHQQRFQDAYTKAVHNWQLAFKDDAEHFYDAMLDASTFYAKDVEFFLSLVGLGLRNYVGPISMHLMAVCSNQNILEHLARNSSVSVLSFPAPPIIPYQYRQAFAHALMAVLCRDVYVQLSLNEPVMPNEKLDQVLGAYLGFNYSGPPASYMHVEHTGGGWYLHTHIEGTPTATPPIADGFHVPVPRFAPPVTNGLIVQDLFFYGTEQSYPLASMTMELDFVFAPDIATLLYIKRSDTPIGDVDFPIPPHAAVTVPVLSTGLTWELWLELTTPVETLPPLSFAGRMFFTDDHGNESNRAYWSIAGNALAALPFTAFRVVTVLPMSYTVVVPDLFAYFSRAIAPLTVGHITLTFAFASGASIFPILKRSDDAGEGMTLSDTPGLVRDLPVPPDGVTWQLGFIMITPPVLFIPAIFSGEIWVEDDTGAESNHAPWRLYIALLP